MSASWKCDLFLCKPLDTVAYHIDTSLITCVELQHCFLVRISQQRPCQAQYGCSLADTWHPADNNVWHVSIFCDDLQALDSLSVANNIVQVDRSVFLHPG